MSSAAVAAQPAAGGALLPLPPAPGGRYDLRARGSALAHARGRPVRPFPDTDFGAVSVRCLALNASFEPLTMVPIRRALRLVIEGKAEIVESDSGDVVRSERLTLPKPAIIRLMKFVHVPRRFRRQVTNTFLFARDGYRCQYCHRGNAELRHRECLTRDHLIPLSRGGDNEWTNVVTACSTCNTRKGNHLPEECGMHPHAVPREPHFVHLSWAVRRLSMQQAKYIRLFYGAEVLATLESM